MRPLVLVLFAWLATAGVAAAQLPEMVLTNGRIWTGVREKPWAEAVAIARGKILKVGSRAEIARISVRGTRIVDLGGRLVTPGFNDAHIHFLGGALDLAIADLNAAGSLPEIQRRVAAWARANPDAPWVTGVGWQYSDFADGRFPTRAALDVVVSDRPVYLRSYDGHTVWVNSRALQLAGITKDTKVAGFGEIVRDPATGEATGILKEGAIGLVSRVIPAPDRARKLAALRAGLKLAASLGITSMQNASGDPESLALYQDLFERGELTVRTGIAFSIGPETTSADLARFAALRDKLRGNPMLRAGAVKLLLDGVIESHTAALLAPYSDQPDRGELAMPSAKFADLVSTASQAGFQIYTHAIGDRAVRVALDGYETVGKAQHLSDPRFRIEHIEVVAPEDIPRFARIGVLASMEPIHADPGTVAVWSKAVGSARLPFAFAWADFVKSGAHLVYSSDWPAAIALDPIRGLHNAVNRRTVDGKPPGGWIPAQRVSLEQALRSYTAEGAYASFEENFKGKIAPGMAADLIAFSQDLFRIDPMQIASTKVVLTVVGGKIVWWDNQRFKR